VEKADSSDQAIDAAIKKSLKTQNQPITPETVAAMGSRMKVIMEHLKSGFESNVVTTQTYDNIVVNQRFSPADFAIRRAGGGWLSRCLAYCQCRVKENGVVP
jgi:hypothetical protein